MLIVFIRFLRPGMDSSATVVTEEVAVGRERIWRELQEDLAKRSTHGRLRVAEQSEHNIHLDQPELVIQAIRDVLDR